MPMLDYEETFRSYDRRMSAMLRESKHEYDIPPMPPWVGIRVTYPFLGATARVFFYDRIDPKNQVSTYLDANNALGYMEVPYFEIYPTKDGDTERFLTDKEDQKEMYKAILESLRQQRKDRKKSK